VSPLRGLRAAIAWLTVIPVPAEPGADPVPWFPWAGIVLGSAGALAAAGVGAAVPGDLGALLAGVVVVASWAALTGMMHLDGLADAFDALTGTRSREERLRIMRDSRIGSFGAGALTLALLTCAASSGVLVSTGRLGVLVLAPVMGRWSAAVALSTLQAARPDGLEARLVSARPAGAHLLAALPLALVGGLARPGLPSVAAGVVAALAIPRLLSRRVGGLTGDIVGASIVLVEAVVLFIGAIVPASWLLP